MKDGFCIEQDWIRGHDIASQICVRHYGVREANKAINQLRELNAHVLGVAIQLSPTGHATAIALATSEIVFLLSHDVDSTRSLPPAVQCLGDILCGSSVPLVGFDMACLALQLHYATQYHVRGVDLSTLFCPPGKTWLPSQCVKEKLFWAVDKRLVDSLWEVTPGEDDTKRVCVRAWISFILGERYESKVWDALKVDTRLLTKQELKFLAELVVQDYLLVTAKPTETKNEFTSIRPDADGNLDLRNARFSNRVRPSHQTSVIMTTINGQEVTGRAIAAKGKSTTITTRHEFSSENVTNVRVVGREELTNSERARNEFVLLVLRGERKLSDSFYVRLLWFPEHHEQVMPSIAGAKEASQFMDMNASQRQVVFNMISNNFPLVIAHGPPGTGKSSTIACAVQLWDEASCTAWIVAQSNVAVKNIAQSLCKRHVRFKIIVSQEFYVEWHEHVYTEIEDNLMVTDDLPTDIVVMERMICGSSIILCTLSMLSNPSLEEKGVFKLVPVERLVIDEASQINVYEYLHIFHKFHRLQKVCLFGDPKQLPPYGKDTVPSLQSIFDIKHLKSSASFLDTQYRMPVPLGEFISREIYNNKLRSEHKITDMSCISFVDVSRGREQRGGTSWKNVDEVNTIVHLVRYYYREKNFCIITPYDAQRAAIEHALKTELLPHDRVFNVDSFQGNEADYVLISVVRTEHPGFLKSENRMNVMLTRCRAGTVIVTNRTFLRTANAQGTLLGKLAQQWEKHRGQMKTWSDWNSVLNREVDMPGVSRPAAHTLTTSPSSVLGPFNGPNLVRRIAYPGPQPRPDPVSVTSNNTVGRNRADGAMLMKSTVKLPSASESKKPFRGSFGPIVSTSIRSSTSAFPPLAKSISGSAKLKGKWRNGSEVVKRL